MKKILLLFFAVCTVSGAFAIDRLYRGASADAKDLICYYNRGNFYIDQERKELFYSHSGTFVAKGEKASAKTAIYRIAGGRIFKGTSVKQEDCLATIVEIKTRKGCLLEGRIYEGFVMVRDVVLDTSVRGVEHKMSFNVTTDGLPPNGDNTKVKLLYTIKEGKVYRGESTDDKDCVLTFTGAMDASRLLFAAMELVK